MTDPAPLTKQEIAQIHRELPLVRAYIRAHPGCTQEPLTKHLEAIEAWVKKSSS